VANPTKVEIPEVTFNPPAAILTPLPTTTIPPPAVTIPIESTLVTSSYVNVPAIETFFSKVTSSLNVGSPFIVIVSVLSLPNVVLPLTVR